MRRVGSSIGRISVAFLLASCAGASPRPADDPTHGATEKDTGEPSSASTPGSETRSPLADDPTAANVLDATAPANANGGYDLDEWAYQHRIQVDIVADACEAPGLGRSPKDYIWCSHHREQPQTVVYTRALYTARGEKMVKLVEIPVAIALLDDEDNPRPESERTRVRLELTRTDATHVSLREASGFDCAKVKSDNQADKAATPALYKELAQGIDRICSQRGTWTFAGGTLRRTGR